MVLHSKENLTWFVATIAITTTVLGIYVGTVLTEPAPDLEVNVSLQKAYDDANLIYTVQVKNTGAIPLYQC